MQRIRQNGTFSAQIWCVRRWKCQDLTEFNKGTIDNVVRSNSWATVVSTSQFVGYAAIATVIEVPRWPLFTLKSANRRAGQLDHPRRSKRLLHHVGGCMSLRWNCCRTCLLESSEVNNNLQYNRKQYSCLMRSTNKSICAPSGVQWRTIDCLGSKWAPTQY